MVENCDFANGHGGITIGREMTGGVRNVYARDLTNSAQFISNLMVENVTVGGVPVDDSGV